MRATATSPFPAFMRTAEYLKKRMQEAGLSSVELVETPADGVTQVGYWTMPLAWDVRSARLEILDDSVPAASRVLADYEKVPSSLGMWSGPTPAGGVTAEVVEVKKGDVRNSRQNGPARQAGADRRESSEYQMAAGEGRRARRHQHLHRKSRPCGRPAMDQRVGRRRMGVHQTERSAAVILDHAAPGGVVARLAGARHGPRQGDGRYPILLRALIRT